MSDPNLPPAPQPEEPTTPVPPAPQVPPAPPAPQAPPVAPPAPSYGAPVPPPPGFGGPAAPPPAYGGPTPPPPPSYGGPTPPPPPGYGGPQPTPAMGGSVPPGALPPGGGYPAGGYPMTPAVTPGATFSATDAFAYGWGAFKANLGPLIVIALVIVAVNMVTGFLQQTFDNWLVGLVFNTMGLLISLVLALGLMRAALIILDGRKPKVEDVLSLQDIAPYIIATLLVWLITSVGLLLCIIPGIIAAYLFQFYGFAILDRKADDVGGAPSTDPVGAMRTSFKITSSHVGELILLLILVGVANMIGAILCLVGLLVTLPVSYIATAYAWRFFTKGTIAPQSA